MGAAQSSNTAEAITNITNFIDNSTNANTNQISQLVTKISLDGCALKLGKNIDIEMSAKLAQKNNQIISAKQDANVTNNVQQQMLQQAQSKVGAFGIGFANASNNSSQLVNSTNQILNAMNAACNQYSSINQEFNCKDTYIEAKNLQIGFNSSVEFLSNQTLNNDQVANIVNDISQVTDQKAKATVEGIGGMLLLLLLAIAAIIYALTKPLSSGSVKILVGAIMCVGVVAVIIVLYLKEIPPFFSKYDECINNSQIGMGERDGVVSKCINAQKRKIHLAQPVMRYNYAVTPNDISQSGGNLVQMTISAKSGQSILGGMGVNGGYNASTFETLDTILKSDELGKNYTSYALELKIPMIPNPLFVPRSASGEYYLVPGNYGGSLEQSDQNNKNICTPGTIQVGSNTSSQRLEDCPQFVNPTILRTVNSLNSTNKDNIIANLNTKDWNDYINMTGIFPPGQQGYNGNDESTVRALFARFVLTDIIGNIDLHHYVHEKELVKFRNKFNNIIVGQAKDIKETYPDDIYLYHPYSFSGNWTNGLNGPGYIYGNIGVVDNNNYKFQKFMKNIGIWIFIGIFASIILFMAYQYYKNNKSTDNKQQKMENKENDNK